MRSVGVNKRGGDDVLDEIEMEESSIEKGREINFSKLWRWKR